jgi:hypothetical protein
MSEHESEAGEEPIGTELGVLAPVQITRGSCRGEGPDSECEGIGVLDLSNSPAGVSVSTLALDARRDDGKRGKEFFLDSGSPRPWGFECMETVTILLIKDGELTGLGVG